MSKYLQTAGIVLGVAGVVGALATTGLWADTDPVVAAADTASVTLTRDDIKARTTVADISSRNQEREVIRIAEDRETIRQINQRIKERRQERRQEARQEAREAARIAAAEEATEAEAAEQESVSSSSEGTSVLTGVWRDLAMCESGLNTQAYNPDGPWMGLFQFAQSTWESVGGTGDPRDASAAEQLQRAQILQSRSGWGPWPHCASQLGLL